MEPVIRRRQKISLRCRGRAPISYSCRELRKAVKIIILLLAIVIEIALLMVASGLLRDCRIDPRCESGLLGYHEC